MSDLNIPDAASKCASLHPGATLGYVRNKAENLMLLELVKRTHGVDDTGLVWMGTFRSRTVGM